MIVQVTWWAVMLAMSGCGGIVVIDGARGDGGSGGSTATTTTTTTTTTTVDTECGPGWGDECDLGDYCDRPDDLCGTGIAGACTPKPSDCSGVPEQPVCSCDGTVYPSACMAHKAGADLSAVGLCTSPAGTYPCGSIFCVWEGEYCEIVVEGSPTQPDQLDCKPLPPSCGVDPSCGCLANEPCGGDCDEPLPNRFQLVCGGN